MPITIQKSLVDSIFNTVMSNARTELSAVPFSDVALDAVQEAWVKEELVLIAKLAELGVEVQSTMQAVAGGITIPKAVFDSVVTAVFSALATVLSGHPLMQLGLTLIQNTVTDSEPALLTQLASLGITVQ